MSKNRKVDIDVLRDSGVTWHQPDRQTGNMRYSCQYTEKDVGLRGDLTESLWVDKCVLGYRD